MTTSTMWTVTAFDQRFVAGGAPRLDDRGTYRPTAPRGRRCSADPRLVIVDPTFLQNSGGPANYEAEPGSKITVTEPYTGRRGR